MELKSAIGDLRKIDETLHLICEGLSVAPGSIFRIASQYLVNWGILITDENREWIEEQSNRSYREEWRGGSGESNEAIAHAIEKANLIYGNDYLNTVVAEMTVEILDGMSHGKDRKKLIICDMGAGTGGTTGAVLDMMELKKKRKLSRLCHFYLVEPSLERLREANERLKRHSLQVDYELVCSSQEVHLSMIRDSRFDMMVSTAVFHHMSFPTYLQQIREKMADGGVMVVGDWFTTMWQHPAQLVPILRALGATEPKQKLFETYFNVRREDIQRLERALTPQQREANRYMLKYVIALAEEMRGVESKSRLCFLEAHESVNDRLSKMQKAGFETDIAELREKHRGFARIAGTVRSIYPTHDIACVVTAAKMPTNRLNAQ